MVLPLGGNGPTSAGADYDATSSLGLEPLVTNAVLTDMKMYVCPSSSVKAATYFSGITGQVFANTATSAPVKADLSPIGLSYHYLPGMNANTCTSDSGILFDGMSGSSPNHEKFGNILFGDGHVGSYVSGSADNFWAKKTNWRSDADVGVTMGSGSKLTGNAVDQALGVAGDGNGNFVVE